MHLQAKLQRQMSGRAAGPSGVNQNSHRLPPGAKRSYAVASSLCWAPNDPERFCAVFAAHVQELADNRFIKQEQVSFLSICAIHRCCSAAFSICLARFQA